jgi:hypothetical protein
MGDTLLRLNQDLLLPELQAVAAAGHHSDARLQSEWAIWLCQLCCKLGQQAAMLHKVLQDVTSAAVHSSTTQAWHFFVECCKADGVTCCCCCCCPC